MRIRLTVGWLTFRARATSDESSRKVSVMIRKRWAEKKAFFFDMSYRYQSDIRMSTQTTQNQQPHPVTGTVWTLGTVGNSNVAARQKVGNLKPEHFGQLGKVLRSNHDQT